MDCSAVEAMPYGHFKTSSKAILRRVLSKRDIREAQENDDFCSSILNSTTHMHRGFFDIDGLLYSRKQNCLRLFLPIALLDMSSMQNISQYLDYIFQDHEYRETSGTDIMFNISSSIKD